MLEIERGSTRSHCVENSLYKKLWTCHEAGYWLMKIMIRMMMMVMMIMMMMMKKK